jgi:hypothetical protein
VGPAEAEETVRRGDIGGGLKTGRGIVKVVSVQIVGLARLG